MSKNEITQDLLKEYFEYRDGHLWWVKPTANNVKMDDQFGCCNKGGYRHGMLKGKRYLEHRLIWLYHHGVWPKQLDHVNGIPVDNRIENLRECTQQQNRFNTKSVKGSSSQHKGVSWYKASGKWKAQYIYQGKHYYLGLYECEEEAAEAYRKATEQLHKDFANYE